MIPGSNITPFQMNVLYSTKIEYKILWSTNKKNVGTKDIKTIGLEQKKKQEDCKDWTQIQHSSDHVIKFRYKYMQNKPKNFSAAIFVSLISNVDTKTAVGLMEICWAKLGT
jgi:hypothetical protein